MRVGPDVSLMNIVGNDSPLFVTRWWDFRPSHWAMVAFSSERTVDRWIRDLPGGGYVLGFASHHFQEHIAERNRGRVFGIYQFVPEKVFHTDPYVIDPAYLDDATLYRKDNTFRWPYGLRAVRAWEFNKTVKTGGTLPTARSLSYEATTDMVAISTADFVQVNQHLLHEVEVFNIPFNPLVLRAPNAQPDENYILYCKDPEVLGRIPGYRYGDWLIKPGIASNREGRLESLNNHALARIFGLKLKPYWSESAASPEIAAQRELDMIKGAQKLGCRLVGSGQQEFLFGNEDLLIQIMQIGRPRN